MLAEWVVMPSLGLSELCCEYAASIRKFGIQGKQVTAACSEEPDLVEFKLGWAEEDAKRLCQAVTARFDRECSLAAYKALTKKSEKRGRERERASGASAELGAKEITSKSKRGRVASGAVVQPERGGSAEDGRGGDGSEHQKVRSALALDSGAETMFALEGGDEGCWKGVPRREREYLCSVCGCAGHTRPRCPVVCDGAEARGQGKKGGRAGGRARTAGVRLATGVTHLSAKVLVLFSEWH